MASMEEGSSVECLDKLHDAEQYIHEQLREAESMYKDKAPHEKTLYALCLAKKKMLEYGVKNIKTDLVQSIVHNRMQCQCSVDSFVEAVREIHECYVIHLGWETFAEKSIDYVIHDCKGYLCNNPTNEDQDFTQAVHTVQKLASYLRQLATDAVRECEKDEGLMNDFLKASMINYYYYKAERLDVLLRPYAETGLCVEDKVNRAHALLVMALEIEDQDVKVKCFESVVRDIKIALGKGVGTIPPEGYYFQAKAYEGLRKYKKALSSLSKLTGRQPPHVEHSRKTIHALLSDSKRMRDGKKDKSTIRKNARSDERGDSRKWSTEHIPTKNKFLPLMPLASPAEDSSYHTSQRGDVMVCRMQGMEFRMPVMSVRNATELKEFERVTARFSTKAVHPVSSTVTKSVQQLLASFPLKDRDIRMACAECFKRKGRHGISAYIYDYKANHKCRMDTLIVRRKDTPDAKWAKIRPLPEFKENAPVKYILCPKFLDGQLCRFGEVQCRFAHYEDELFLWKKMSNERRHNKRQAFMVEKFKEEFRHVWRCLQKIEILRERFTGKFDYYCALCFYSNPSVLSQRLGITKRCASADSHKWKENECLLIYIDLGVEINLIRPYMSGSAWIGECEFKSFCKEPDCSATHSKVEKAMWIMEKLNTIPRKEIVEEFTNPRFITSPTTGEKDIVRKPAKKSCPYKVLYVCGYCFTGGKPNLECGHVKQNKMYFTLYVYEKKAHGKDKMYIHVRECVDPYCKEFKICEMIQMGSVCTYIGHCKFAHSEGEKTIWTWMRDNKVRSLAQLVDLAAPRRLATGTFPCKICMFQFSTKLELTAHFASPEHIRKSEELEEALSDNVWKYRPPPLGESVKSYRMCEDLKNGACVFGENCCKAHKQGKKKKVPTATRR